MPSLQDRIDIYSYFAIILLLMWGISVLYWPGLNSDFYLDDYPNLSALAYVSQPGGFWFSVLQNTSSALGRPLTMLTFALQADNWPANPAAFKKINLLIHLGNTLLVAMISYQLFRIKSISSAKWWALAVTLLWAIAPLHISSILYTVQRMTLLAATFTLTGVALFLYCERLFQQQHFKYGYWLLTLGYLPCLALGVLAKENAILLPLLLLLIDSTLGQGRRRPPRWRWYRWLAWGTPILLLIGYLLFFSSAFNYSYRPFDMTERLLTQSRVLFHYLAQAIWPVGPQLGLYHDSFLLSDGWLSPWYTLPATLGWLGLITTAIVGRQRWPLLSFAIGWFLGAQLLESSVIGLEIYFEHRTYLPWVGPCWALIAGIHQLTFRHPRWQGLIITCTTIYCLMIASLTWQQTRLWGQPLLLAKEKLEQYPDSERARFSAAQQHLKQGDSLAASELLSENKTFIELSAARQGRLLQLSCLTAVNIPEINYWQQIDYDREIITAIQSLGHKIAQQQCSAWPHQKFHELITALDSNPAYRTQQSLQLTRARLLSAERNWGPALKVARLGIRPGNIKAELLCINIALALGDWATATSCFQQAEGKVIKMGWRGLGYRERLESYRIQFKGINHIQTITP